MSLFVQELGTGRPASGPIAATGGPTPSSCEPFAAYVPVRPELAENLPVNKSRGVAGRP